ncbi:MAG: hypothetical protein ACLFNO_03860 [Parcubacteria group bacterium]
MPEKTRWYVRPLNSHTNKVIQRELQGAELVLIKTDIGKSYQAYEVDHAFITNLNASKDDLHLRYRVYKKQGKNSLAREFTFASLKKKVKS